MKKTIITVIIALLSLPHYGFKNKVTSSNNTIETKVEFAKKNPSFHNQQNYNLVDLNTIINQVNIFTNRLTGPIKFSPPKYRITVYMQSMDGEVCYFECSENEYILDAGEEAGITLPFSGRAGADGASAAKLLGGIVDNGDQSYLTDCQIGHGYILLDTSYPRSNCTILTHQEENLPTCS